MILQKEISRMATRYKVRDTQIEKDYVLSWLLFSIAKQSLLRDALVFKGGTALKKVWFEDYRFSEDLDFTLMDDTIADTDLLAGFEKAFEFARREANLAFHLPPSNIVYLDSGSLQLYVNYIGPLKGQLGSRDVKIDITRGEIIETEVLGKHIFRSYSDLEDDFTLRCYSLSEILIEKMAALMGRSEPRDLYDFWYLTEVEGMDVQDVLPDFARKAANKGLSASEFLKKTAAKEIRFKKDWENKLRLQIHDLPPFDTVFREAKRHFRLV
jgi:predicted nucleotidyltransferase component of viral defense system